MISPIPKWVWLHYARLWKKFKDTPFTFEQAQNELMHMNRNLISVMFNELKNAGWIKAQLDEKDARKRVYILMNPIQLVEKSGAHIA